MGRIIQGLKVALGIYRQKPPTRIVQLNTETVEDVIIYALAMDNGAASTYSSSEKDNKLLRQVLSHIHMSDPFRPVETIYYIYTTSPVLWWKLKRSKKNMKLLALALNLRVRFGMKLPKAQINLERTVNAARIALSSRERDRHRESDPVREVSD